jgi:hypothetical protein
MSGKDDGPNGKQDQESCPADPEQAEKMGAMCGLKHFTRPVLTIETQTLLLKFLLSPWKPVNL